MLRISFAIFIVLWIFVSTGERAIAQIPLTLPETAKLAIQANDPSVALFEERALAFEDRAVADSQLPDPVISAKIANFPLASFDYNREAMTQMQVGLKQKFPKGNTLSLMRSKRENEARSQRLIKVLRELQLVRNARMAWLELYYWREARGLTLQSQQKVRELGGVAEAVYASGRSSLQDVLRVDLETTALDAKLIDIERNEDVTRADLGRLIGVANATRPLTSNFPVLPFATNEALISQRMAQHPALKVLDSRVVTRSRDVDLAQEKFKPGWAVDAMYGLRDSRSDFGSIGVSVELPLFSKKNQDYSLSAAKREHAAQKLERDAQALELERQLRREWAQWQRLGERISLTEGDILERAEETSEAAITAYQNQVADFSELVRADLAVLDIRLRLLRLKIDRAKTEANLLYLSGE